MLRINMSRIVVILLSLTFASCGCTIEVLQDIDSSAGISHAVLYYRDCLGAISTGTHYEVSVLPKGKAVGTGKGNVFRMVGAQECNDEEGSYVVRIECDEVSSALTIRYHSNSGILLARTGENNNLIKYRHCDSEGPYRNDK